MSRKKKGRDISGILVLDKPSGKSSNGVLQLVKRLFNANKAGHTGNLDVPASGLLPICLGEATKVSAYLLDANKRYRTCCRLGATTTTGDAAGEIVSTHEIPELSEDQINKTLESFIGDIDQVPPMYSALKQNGQRLYKLAYKGIEVERKSREVTIHQLDLLKHSRNEIEFEVSCSKGTYIRTLSEDIGATLGCGAHIISLRRLAAGPFHESQMLTFEQLDEVAEQGIEALDKLLLPMDIALVDYPLIHLSSDQVHYLYQGQAVEVNDLPDMGSLRLYNDSDQFLGLGEITGDGLLAPKRLINKPQMGFLRQA